jgi:hypothetical protein
LSFWFSATALVTSAIERARDVRLAAIMFTLSVNSFQVPAIPWSTAWPPNLSLVPTFFLDTLLHAVLKISQEEKKQTTVCFLFWLFYHSWICDCISSLLGLKWLFYHIYSLDPLRLFLEGAILVMGDNDVFFFLLKCLRTQLFKHPY